MDGAKFGDRADAEVEKGKKPYTKPVLRQFKNVGRKIGRNEPCPCRSGKKNKNCHNVAVVRTQRPD